MDATSYPTSTYSLNNKAVAFIADGEYEHAITTLAAALMASKQCMAESDTSCDDGQRDDNIIDLDECIAQTQLSSDDDNDDRSWCDLQVGGKNKAYLYHRAIPIPSNLPTCGYEGSVLTSVIIIFNLALSYQLAAESSKKKSRYLSKAAKLYELAHNLYDEEEYESVTFAMACINNMGIIYQELQNVSAAEECFQHVLSTLMFLVDCGVPEVSSSYDGFFRNTTQLICRQSTAPAA